MINYVYMYIYLLDMENIFQSQCSMAVDILARALSHDGIINLPTFTPLVFQ